MRSSFPAFSMAVFISSKGFPIREIPFSINRATGDLGVRDNFSVIDSPISNIVSNLTHKIAISYAMLH
jgi:hypothetical protein